MSSGITTKKREYLKTVRAVCPKCGFINDVFLSEIERGRGRKRSTKYTCQCGAENKVFFIDK